MSETLPATITTTTTAPPITVYFSGVTSRDTAFIETMLNSLSGLLRSIKKKDRDGVRLLLPGINKLPRDAEKVKVIARRAFRGA